MNTRSYSSTIEDDDLSQSTANDHMTRTSAQRRASPLRVRQRGQQTIVSSGPRSLKSKGGRHITNINKINVINNYGVAGDGSGGGGSGGGGGSRYYFSAPWKHAKERSGPPGWWHLLRAGLAALIILWFGLVASLVRNVSEQKSSPSLSGSATSLLDSKKWEKLRYLHLAKAGTLKGVGQRKDSSDDTNGSETTNRSIFDLSLFGNKSPRDFQHYTPHAPSCSAALEAGSVSYTLVSQLSNDRLWMVRYHCERWGDNPMSIAIFSDRDADEVKAQLVSEGCSEKHLTVQTVSKTMYDPTGTEYPVNLLRNLALAAVKTSHIVYADVDFWPAADLHSIMTNTTVKERFASDPKLATVIPVFQMYRRCREYKDCREANIPFMPPNKTALLTLIKYQKASTFDPTNVGGHGSTKYITWRDQAVGTFVDLPCVKSNRYEPYLALRYCDGLPPFQEGFTGYGKNKMTWVMQLRRSGFIFSQLGGAFLVHYPHLDSKSRLEWNKQPEPMKKGHSVTELLGSSKGEDIDWMSFKRARVDALFLDFKKWLYENVEDEARVPMCEDALNDDMRLWVHGDKGSDDDSADEEEKAEESAVETEEMENNNVADSKRAYAECMGQHRSSDAPAECLKAALGYVESLVLVALEGGNSGKLDSDEQMEYFAEADKHVQKFVPSHDDFSLHNFMADLYVDMGVIEFKRHAIDKAVEFFQKALKFNPKKEEAQRMLSNLLGRGFVDKSQV